MTPADRLRSLVKEATRGPWRTVPNPQYVIAGDIEGPTVAVVRRDDFHTGGATLPQEANARLIALTPQLAELVVDMAERLDRIDWYRRCLEDVQDRRVVRGLAEAKAGYDSALDELRNALAGLFPEDSA